MPFPTYLELKQLSASPVCGHLNLSGEQLEGAEAD